MKYCIIVLVSLLASCAQNSSQAPVGVVEARAVVLMDVDLIVLGDYIVVMDANHTVIESGAVVVDDGAIVDVGAEDDIRQRYAPAEVMAGENRIVMPGLVNGHSHAAMTLLRGMADDLSLYEWLNEYIFPAEVAFVDEHFVRIGTELACWEMIRGGTTTFVDMYYFPDAIADVIERCGMRALISATVIDQKSPDGLNAADSLANGEAYIARWKDRNPRIIPILGPHANYTLNDEQLRATRASAQAAGVGISIHVSESPFELQYSKETYGATTIEWLDAMDFFAGPTIAAHVVWPTDEEIEILAARGVGVIHNPTSNMKTAAGVSPVSKMLDAGVLMGIGTDGAASNNDLDLWEEMRLAALLQKVTQMNPEVLSAREVLTMATRGGAHAIGLGDRVGSLEVGKRADLIQVSFNDVHHLPTYDVVSHLVYVTDEQDVESVLIDGQVVMRDKQILTIDTLQVRAEAARMAEKIKSSLDSR